MTRPWYRGWPEVEEKRFICIKLSRSPAVNPGWILGRRQGTYLKPGRLAGPGHIREGLNEQRRTRAGVAGLMSSVHCAI